jgi:hypothetical protein
LREFLPGCVYRDLVGNGPDDPEISIAQLQSQRRASWQGGLKNRALRTRGFRHGLTRRRKWTESQRNENQREFSHDRTSLPLLRKTSAQGSLEPFLDD